MSPENGASPTDPRPSWTAASGQAGQRWEIAALARWLDRETPFIRRHPDLLAPQLHNRLQLEGGLLVLRERAARALAARPWARLVSPPATSAGGELHVLEHGSRTTRVRFSSAGDRLASAGTDGMVRLWDRATGRCVEEIDGGSGRTEQLRWSPDGRLLAWAGEDGGIAIYDVVTGSVQRFPDRGGVFAWSPDGRLVASGGAAIHLWDARSGETAARLEGEKILASAIDWSADGARIATGTSWGRLRVWSVEAARCEVALELGIPVPRRPQGYWIEALAWSRRGLLAAAVRDGTLAFFSPQPWHEAARVKVDQGWATALAWAPDGSRLAVACGATVELIEVARCLDVGSVEGESPWARLSARDPLLGSRAVAAPVAAILAGHAATVTSLDWSGDGETIASAGLDGTIRLWDATTVSSAPAAALASERVSPEEGEPGAAALAEALLRERTAETARLPAQPEEGPRRTAFAWSADGARLATGFEDGEIRVCGARGDEGETVVIEGWKGPTGPAPPSPGFFDPLSNVRIGGHRLRLFDREYQPVQALAWSPDATRLAAAGVKLGLKIHDLATGARQRCDTGGRYLDMRHLSWSPDGAWLASAQGARNALLNDPFIVRLWNPATGAARTIWESGSACWCALAWSPDGTLLVFASEDGSVRIWSAAADRALLVARSASSLVSLRFDEEGRRLLAVDDGQATAGRPLAYVWRLEHFTAERLVAETARLSAAYGEEAVQGRAAGTAPREEPTAFLTESEPGLPRAAAEETARRERAERAGHADALFAEARDLALRRELPAALRRLGEAAALWEELGERAALAQLLGIQGALLAEMRQRTEARETLARQARVLRELGDPVRLAEELLRQVEVLLALGATGDAHERATEAEALFASLGRVGEETQARALKLRARLGRATLLKASIALLLVLVPAAVGILLGRWNPWLWSIGVPLVLLSAFLLATSFSSRLRQAVERKAVELGRGTG